MSITIGTAITATSYSSILTTVTSVLTTYYGVAQASQVIVAGNRIKAQDWRNLYEDINRALKHQTNASMPISNITTGSVLTSQFANSLTNYANQISVNRSIVSVSQLVQDSTRSTSTRATTWGSNITHEVQYTWNSDADAAAFFNQGGYLFPDLSIVTNAFGSAENIAWSAMVSNTAQDIINQPGRYTFNRENYLTSFPTFSYQTYPYTIDVYYFIVNNHTIKARMVFNTHSGVGLQIGVLPKAVFYNFYSTDATGGVAAPRPSILVTSSLDMGGATLYPRLTYTPAAQATVNQYAVINRPITVVNTGSGVCTIANYGFVPQAGSGLTSGSITINTTTVTVSGSAILTLQIDATGAKQGTYTDNYLEVFSNSITGTVRIPIKIVVSEPVFTVDVTPSTVTATSVVTTIAPVVQHFTFTAGLTGKIFSYTASVDNPQYFKVTGLSTNVSSASLIPDNAVYPNLLFTTFTPPRAISIGDIVGTYTTNLTLTFVPLDYHQQAVTYTIPIKYDVNIANHNLGKWLSPKDSDNAVFACSYDLVGGERFLTVAFGMGADGSTDSLAGVEEDITETRTKTTRTNQGHGDYSEETTTETVVVGHRSAKASAVYASPDTIGILGDADRHLGIPLYLSARTDFCAFLQEYGSWITGDGGHGYNSSFDLTYNFSVPVSGNYSWEFAAVGSSTLYIDGVALGNSVGYSKTNTGSLSLSAGNHTVRIVTGSSGTGATDSNGIVLRDSFGSFGVNIKDSNGNTWWSTKTPRRVAYKYWSEVYRFPIAMDQKKTTLYSKDYPAKLTDIALGNTYGSWCGVKEYAGSMFIVLHDGRGNVTVSMNPWEGKKSTGNISLNRTLAYSISLPYYYSALNNRVNNLESPFSRFKTHFFLGFYPTGKIRLSEQAYPYVANKDGTQAAPGSSGGDKFWSNLIVAAAIAGITYLALGAAFTLTIAAIGVTLGAVAIASGVGVLAFLALAACFTEDTLVSMADGTFKMIKDVRVGDMVFNHDKTQVNRVTYIETTLDTRFGQLYSITKDQKPFITINHPMYINGKLSSVYPERIYNCYPWLGKTSPLIPDRIVEATGQPVYNLWTTGDHTYIVNGYGTTTINGDGGWGRLLVEQGITTPERLGEVLFECASGGIHLSYGAHVCDRILAKLNIKIVNRIIGKVMDSKDNPPSRRAILKLFKAVGRAAVYITERKLRK